VLPIMAVIRLTVYILVCLEQITDVIQPYEDKLMQLVSYLALLLKNNYY